MGYHGNGLTVTYPNPFTGMSFQIVTVNTPLLCSQLLFPGLPLQLCLPLCPLSPYCPNCTLHRGLGPPDRLPPAPLLPRASQTSHGRPCDECFGSDTNVDSSSNSDLRSRELHTGRWGNNIVEKMAHLEETVSFSGCHVKECEESTTTAPSGGLVVRAVLGMCVTAGTQLQSV